MQASKIVLRITKILGKAILGLLILVFIAVALIHLPSVQRKITHVLVNYLSSKIESRVEIKRIGFSLLGDVAIEEISLWDRSDNKILSAQKIEVSTSIVNLLTGDYIFDEVSLEGVDGELIQREEGLNIQFILDAFRSKETPSTSSNPVTLQFNSILLENINVKYSSITNGTTVDVQLIQFKSQGAEYAALLNKVKAENVFLQHAVINILSTQHPETHLDTLKSIEVQDADTSSSFTVEIADIDIEDSDFSFHQNQVTNTPKFDPAHISLASIQTKLSNFLISNDTLAASLQFLSAQFPGFNLDQAKAEMQWSHHRLTVSGLHVASTTNEIDADYKGPYDFRSETDNAIINIAVHGSIHPTDFAYFFSDSVMNRFKPWELTELMVEGNYFKGKGEIKTLDLISGNSRLHADGMVNEVFDLQKLNWKELTVNATIGSAFNGILTPFLRNINFPPDISLQLNSSGNPKKLVVDGKVYTTWGDVKAIGQVTQPLENLGMNINLTGEKVDLGKWMNLSWMGPMDLSVAAKGIIGDDTNIEINGRIDNVEMLDQSIHDITFQSWTKKSNSTVTMTIADPHYQSVIRSEISFDRPLQLTSQIELDSFMLGGLLHLDSTLLISGRTKSKIIIDPSSLEGYLEGDRILLQNKSIEYWLDSVTLHTALSPTTSTIEYYTDHAKANVESNFDLRDLPNVINTWSTNTLKVFGNSIHPIGSRTAHVSLDMQNAILFQLLGIDVKEFSSLHIEGEFDEQQQLSALEIASGKYTGYGISLDTLHGQLKVNRDTASASMNASNLLYNSIRLGDLDFDIITQGDTAHTELMLSYDTTTLLGLQARIFPADSGAFVYTDKLMAFDNDYIIDPENSVFIGNHTMELNHLSISRDSMQINMDGDLSAFDISLKQVDLTPLNYLISPDTTLINKGYLTGMISYSGNQQINLKAAIDSLRLYNSTPLTINATALSDGNQIPFQFLLTNTSNKVDLKGNYHSDNTEVEADLVLDINNLELFAFLVSGFIEEMNGSLKGEASISGPIQKPAVKGNLKFLDVGLTTVNPRLTFNIEEEMITLDNSSLLLDDFTLYDQDHHPLTINGKIVSEDYQSYAYDLLINSDNYTLINNPDSTSGKLRGRLVMDSDIKLKGNEKDTNVEAKLTIKDATDLTFVTSSDDIELLKAEGIIDFVDPLLLMDTVTHEASGTYYDSLIASLPAFNLNSTIIIEDNALLRLIIDEQSGDYIATSGGANLELGYDRTGNLQLSGNYTINKGVYRLSFYDLVKKNFTLVKGSSINWNGSPKNGDLNIKAVHTVESNSIGLVGHEIGENEKSIYKRSLDYEVGININGTIEKPIISFSLDLPKDEKVSYPVLANKLDRLRQPEYESELNKQVFGLLVLGGFLPESSADVNSTVIATTALSNSVNSLLASQLNRFASQYVKGVNIDVGIQSFSDYSTPGGKTQTAMDFRVSKSLMNERLSFEIGGDFDINQDQSGANTGTKNYRGDIAIIYDLTGNGDKQLKLFNNETYDIIYQEIRNTGISLIFIREFESKEKNKSKNK